MKHRFIRPEWLLVAYSICILVVTHTPPDDLPSVPRVNDKVVHFALYAVWGLIAGFSSRGNGFRWMLTGMALALGDELTQPFFERHLDWWDWVADCLGLLVGYSAIRLIRLRFGGTA